MSMLYAVESWVLAVVGWGWIALRDFIPERPLLEELCVYSTLLVSTLHFALCTVIQNKTELSKAYLGFMLILWTYLTYALLDGIWIFDTGSQYVPGDADLCCPNRDVPLMNRRFYFGGVSFFLATGAVTFAFQTVQVFVAGASLVSGQGSLWPGNGWGYGSAAMLAVAYAIRFSGLVTRPCPMSSFQSLLGLDLSFAVVFSMFSFVMILMILADGLVDVPMWIMITVRVLGLVVMSLFCASVCIASHGQGMLTMAVMLLLAKAWLPVCWGVAEPWFGVHGVVPPAEGVTRKLRRAVRWVVPMQAKLDEAGRRVRDTLRFSETLPCPLSMGPSHVQKKRS